MLETNKMDMADWINIVAIFVTGVGIIIALCFSIKQAIISNKQTKISIKQTELMNKQMRVSLFADYTKRYQEIMLNFPLNINEDDFDIKQLGEKHPKRYDKTMRYMRVYFDLCSEEFFLNEEGYLDEKVWIEWRSGIELTFKLSAFKSAWKIATANSQFYDDFAKWIDEDVLKV
jgi:hypothetical protein